jgi:hypothetical protein
MDMLMADHLIYGRMSLSWTSGYAKTPLEDRLSGGASILNETKRPANMSFGKGLHLQLLVRASRSLEQDER